jgi:tetratricopeptide (TPR) repeat protein
MECYGLATMTRTNISEAVATTAAQTLLRAGVAESVLGEPAQLANEIGRLGTREENAAEDLLIFRDTHDAQTLQRVLSAATNPRAMPAAPRTTRNLAQARAAANALEALKPQLTPPPGAKLNARWLGAAGEKLARELDVVTAMAHVGQVQAAWNRFNKIDGDVVDSVSNTLGAYAGALAACAAMCPDGDLTREPPFADPADLRLWHNDVGIYLTGSGKLPDAATHYARAAEIAEAQIKANVPRAWFHLSIAHENAAELAVYRGDLAEVRKQVAAGIAAAQHDVDNEERKGIIRDCRAYLAAAILHAGDRVGALGLFAEVSAEEPLEDIGALWQAEALAANGQWSEAQRLAQNTLTQADGSVSLTSQALQVLGAIQATLGQPVEARRDLDRAVDLSRGITAQHVLIQALLARGRALLVGRTDATQGITDLLEARDLAASGGYAIYENEARKILQR